MVKEYSCENCGQIFSQKGHFTNHQKRKRPCKPVKNKVIEEKVQEKIHELVQNGDIEIKNTNLKSNSKQTSKNMIDDNSTIVEINDEIAKVETLLKNTKNSLKPIIKWSGGKKDEIKLFEKYIPEYDTYIEPFIGGGGLYFHLAPEKAVIADVHRELICLYNAIKNEQIDEIYEFMVNHPNEEKTYYEVRDNMDINSDLDRAKQFYYQRKTCFRGMLRYNKNGKFNIPYGRYKTCNYEDLKNKDYENLLKRTDIIRGSFEEIFDKYNDENNFVFLDPPYDSEFTDYGYCNFGKEEQKKLAECFKNTKNKCLMIIGKTDFIVDLYKDYIVDEYDKKYKFKIHSKRVGSEINTKHLVIKNY